MALNPKQGSQPQAGRYWFEEIEMRLHGIQPEAPMPEVEWTGAGELINLNHLIEDVGALLPAAMVGHRVLAYDLAADLPLIEGDYRFIRRLLLNLLSDVDGKITLRTRFTQPDRDYLTAHFPVANLSEREYVLLQVTDTDLASTPGSGSICQFLFPCAAMETQGEPAAMVEPQADRRADAGSNREWLITHVQRTEKGMQSARYTRSHDIEVSRGTAARNM